MKRNQHLKDKIEFTSVNQFNVCKGKETTDKFIGMKLIQELSIDKNKNITIASNDNDFLDIIHMVSHLTEIELECFSLLTSKRDQIRNNRNIKILDIK